MGTLVSIHDPTDYLYLIIYENMSLRSRLVLMKHLENYMATKVIPSTDPVPLFSTGDEQFGDPP